MDLIVVCGWMMACMEWGGSDLFQACFGPGSDPIQISWLLGPALHTVHKFGHVAKTGYGAFRIQLTCVSDLFRTYFSHTLNLFQTWKRYGH